MTPFIIGLVSSLSSTPVPGKVEALESGDFYTMYITGGNGERKAPAVLAHTHLMTDITGLPTELAGKESAFVKGGFSAGTGITITGAASSRLVGAGTLDISLDTAYLGNTYVRKAIADNINANHNFTGTGLRLSSHYFHNTHPSLLNNVYIHYYDVPEGDATTVNMRVRDGAGSYKALSFSGSGSFVWNGQSVVLGSRQVATQFSIQGGGNLSADRTLQLVGDVASPGPNMSYSTNASGVRGWYANATYTETDPVFDSWKSRIVYGDGIYATVSYGAGDANSLTKSGFYYVHSNAANRPNDENSHVIHVNHPGSASYWMQIGSPYITGRKLYYRKNNNGAIEGWIPLATEGFVTSSTRSNTWVPSWGEVTSKPTTLSGYGLLTESDNRYVNASGDTMSGNLTFAADGQGVFFFGGGAVYKRGGTGMILRRSSGDPDWQVESNDGSNRWTIWHSGNITPVPTNRTLQFTANDGLNVSGTGISDLSANRTVTFGISGIDTSKITSGTLSVARGGTGLSSFGSPGQVIMTNGSSNYWGTVSGGVSGGGANGRFALWNSGSNLVYGELMQDGSGRVGIGATDGAAKLYVDGLTRIGNQLQAQSLYTSGTLTVESTLQCYQTGQFNVKVKVGSASDISGASFQVDSPTKASMPFPRLTTSQWNAISKVEAMFAWNLDEHGLMWWDGSRTAILRFDGSNYQGWLGSTYTNF